MQPSHTTDDMFAAGAAASAAPDHQVAETMIQGNAAMMKPDSADNRESTTLMPVWQPPPAAPATAGIAETMAIDSKTRPPAGSSPTAGREADLTMEAGPDAGHSHRAGDRPLRLGRSPDNDIILRDPATSGHHARVERRGDQFWIVDLGSTNGTLVNGEPIQEKELSNGDRITIGQNAVNFSLIES
ncbi:MAG: hypothetical protein PVSMB3_03280 [Candidatus Dormibacteraceae bacterium]